jgi:hypothetical protein
MRSMWWNYQPIIKTEWKGTAAVILLGGLGASLNG